MIKLVSVDNEEKTLEIIDMINQYDSLRSEFGDKIDRLACSEYSFLIKKNEDTVGFANLVYEKEDYRFLFLDIGIKDEYQGKGIAKEVQKQIEKFEVPQYIIIETSINNHKAINSLKSRIRIKVIEDRVFYLLQRKRYEEFIVFNGVDNLIDHYNKLDEKKIK